KPTNLLPPLTRRFLFEEEMRGPASKPRADHGDYRGGRRCYRSLVGDNAAAEVSAEVESGRRRCDDREAAGADRVVVGDSDRGSVRGRRGQAGGGRRLVLELSAAGAAYASFGVHAEHRGDREVPAGPGS